MPCPSLGQSWSGGGDEDRLGKGGRGEARLAWRRPEPRDGLPIGVHRLEGGWNWGMCALMCSSMPVAARDKDLATLLGLQKNPE
jgi:hypothetical protein